MLSFSGTAAMAQAGRHEGGRRDGFDRHKDWRHEHRRDRDHSPAHGVPEIDAMSGIAALAVAICFGLLVREKFFRGKSA